jgi:uncharacterized membrane protein
MQEGSQIMAVNEQDAPNLADEKIKLDKNWSLLARIFIIFGVIGWFASTTLLVERIKSLQNPTEKLACDISPFVSCGDLFARWQASLFGFPNPILGVAGFIVPIVIGFGIFAGANFKGWFWRCVVVGLSAAWVFVTWLFSQSIFNIGVLCPYCLVVWFATIPMWWTAVTMTAAQGFWGSKVRDFVKGRTITFLLSTILLNYGVIVLLITLKMGTQIVRSF